MQNHGPDDQKRVNIERKRSHRAQRITLLAGQRAPSGRIPRQEAAAGWRHRVGPAIRTFEFLARRQSESAATANTDANSVAVDSAVERQKP